MALINRPASKPPVAPQVPAITPESPDRPDDNSIAGDKPIPGSPEAVAQIRAHVEQAKAKRAYVKPDLSSITLDVVSPALMDETELAEVPRVTKDAERSEVQVAVDKTYADAYIAWEAASKPTTVRDCYDHDRKVVLTFKEKGEQAPHTQLIVRRFFLDPAQEAGFRVLIRKAAEVHGHGVKILPIASHTSGRHMLVWMPRDVKERTEEAKAKLAAARAAKKAKAEAESAK